jgi:small nuclear ribonucleoprotein (snRNP)-like protein
MIPQDILKRCIGAKVLCILNGNVEAEGVLVEADAASNLILRDATSFRTIPATKSGEKDSREVTAEFSLMFVPNHSIEFIVPGGAKPGQIVTTVASKGLM